MRLGGMLSHERAWIRLLRWFGVGGVVDDFGGADGGGDDVGTATAAVFLVAVGEGYEFRGCGLEGRERAVAEDECSHAGGFFWVIVPRDNATWSAAMLPRRPSPWRSCLYSVAASMAWPRV